MLLRCLGANFFYKKQQLLLFNGECFRRSAPWFVDPMEIQGVFLVKMKNAFVPVKRDDGVNKYSRISTALRRSEQNE